MNNTHPEYELPEWLHNWKRHDLVVEKVLKDSHEDGMNQMHAYENVIMTILSRETFLLSELNRYSEKYGKLEN